MGWVGLNTFVFSSVSIFFVKGEPTCPTHHPSQETNAAVDRLKLEAMPPGLRLEARLQRIRIPGSIQHESELWKWKKIEKGMLKMEPSKLM